MTIRQFMAGAMVCGVLIAGQASAQTPDPQMMAPIQKFIEAFNKGDIPGAAATHAASADLVILDEPPPFLWRGAQAFQAWAGDLDADAKARGITDQRVTIGKATRVETNGTAAYVIVPATYAFKEKGVAMRETAQMTFVLKKDSSDWLIHAWTWTGPRATHAAGK